ncbi:MAG: hypothetical protein J3Q66DRAFT_152684 [Benniella sp.]|nr:MAG: hypothetical protein J3Q66DRAFT_152684 [Benniella sp.]
MSPPQLPLECILGVIHILFNDHHTDTMANLLRVNKTICAATLQFLYKDCFDLITRSSDAHQSLKGPQLVRTLLQQVHLQSRIPDILKVAFLSSDDQIDLESTAQPPPSPMFKYGRFISTIHVSFESIRSMFKSICNGSPLMDYAAENQLYEKYKDGGYIGNNVFGESKESRDILLREVLMVDISQQLTWTLCQDHPESIDSMTIPLNDIQRYIDHVHLFTSLSSAKFSIRGLLTIRRYNRYIYTNDTTHGIKETERDRFFKGMVEFVRQHASIHKNVLRNVEIPQSTQLYRTDQHSTPDVYYAIQSLLPSFQNLRSITTGRIELLARPTDTTLGLLESITVLPRSGNLQDEEISELLIKHPPFLPRYRSLKHLTTETLGPDMFQWAVLEKKKQKEAEEQEGIVDRHMSSWQHGHHTSDLVSLQSISISNKKPSLLIQELNDIAFAFSNSLEEWSVKDGSKGFEEPFEEVVVEGEDEDEDEEVMVEDDTSLIIHGQGWDLPHLRRLSLKVYGVRLHFDMDALERCRALESLTMRDNLTTYRHQDIRSWPVVCLPNLKKLDLKGSPALHFNMDSLYQLPCLEELTMKMASIRCDDGDYCQYRLPSLEGLEYQDPDTEGVDGCESSGIPGSSQAHQSIRRRPQYTWDWHLPNLRKLDLAAVFGLKFDFRWLQHLPNLQSLRVDISSPVETPCRRHITLEDLSRREPQQASNEGGSGEFISGRYISLPKLETIELNGDWIFESKVMDTLCLAVAPNLSSFSYNCRYADLSLRECIALSEKMPRLRMMKLRTLLFWENPSILGMEDIPAEQLGECVNFLVPRGVVRRVRVAENRTPRR